jgi:phosphoesterase RecJ-like protein
MNYSKITKEFTDEFFKLVEASENIVITSHMSPDGDSISCVLSMYRIIKDNFPGKNARIIYSGELDGHFGYFENFDKIEWTDDVVNSLGNSDLLIALDCGSFSRFTRFSEKIQAVKNTICIDHHASVPDAFSASVIVPEMPSCSELIFRLFESHVVLDKNLSETFLLGILTDTGNFIFLDASQSDTFVVAKKLIDAGKINIGILRSTYTGISAREFELVQEFIRNTAFEKIEGWPPFQYTYVSREFTEKEQYTNNEFSTASTAYIAGYLTSIKDYTWGFIIKPKSSYCSVSMRSLPESVNVRELLERMELGGGHDRAAGGIFKKDTDPKDPKICVQQIIEWLKNNKPILN